MSDASNPALVASPRSAASESSLASAPLRKRVLAGVATGSAIPLGLGLFCLFNLGAAALTRPTRALGWDAYWGPPSIIPVLAFGLCPLLLLVGTIELVWARERRTAPIWLVAGWASAAAGVAVTLGLYLAQGAVAEHLYERELGRMERAGRAWLAFEDEHGRAPASVRELREAVGADLRGVRIHRAGEDEERGLPERDVLLLPLADWVADSSFTALAFEPGPREGHPSGIWLDDFGADAFLVAVERR